MTGAWGSGSYGSSPYGGSVGPFRVVDAEAVTATFVRVRFSLPLDVSFAPLTLASNYTIPGLTVLNATLEDPDSVLLHTSQQAYQLYTVTVGAALSAGGATLTPAWAYADFVGLSPEPSARVVATGATRVRVLFSQAMLSNAALTSTGSYDLRDLLGNPVSITDVVPEQGGDIVSVVLRLPVPLVSTQTYVVTLSDQLVTAVGSLEVFPKVIAFPWVQGPSHAVASIQMGQFSGESQEGLLGPHAGLVFFSPALHVAVPASTIQVDEVSVCTRAYDVYTIPVPVDPRPLYTWSPAGPGGTLGNTVLWSTAYRLGEVSIALSDFQEDTVPPAADGRCVATLNPVWDLDYVSLLNNPAWTLNSPTHPNPRIFKTADNSGPVPPGTPTVIVLVP